MKKTIVKILTCIVCLCLLVTTLFACAGNGAGSWTATKMNNWGAVKTPSLGGFTAETDNYIYFVGGSTASSSDNTYGKPVKGALMVADKTDLSKTEVAVPKLFGATDYKAGLYIFGDYVYYGTPSTDKKPDGTVANTEMMFRRAKLDGSSDELLLKTGSLAYEHRIVESDGQVYIVYYDSASFALKSFNTQTKEELVIAKTDEKTEGKQSLESYKFLDNEMLDGAVVVFTTKVFSESYNEEMNSNTGSTRPTEEYNILYAYSVGDKKSESQEVVGKQIFDGSKQSNSTYTIANADKNFVYIESVNAFSTKKTVALSKADFTATAVEGIEVVAEYVDKANLVEGLETVYILDKTDAENVRLYSDTLVKANKTSVSRELIAKGIGISSLLFVNGDYIYYYNTNNNLCRLGLEEGEQVREERISEDTVAVTWYQPEIITVGGKDYIFYCDNSSMGNQNIKYVDLSSAIVEEDTDNNEENDLFYMEGQKFLGKISDADYAKSIDIKITNLSKKLTKNGLLNFDVDEDGNYILDNGKLQFSAIKEMRAEYNALPNPIKEKVASSSVETLKNYERAIDIANKFYTLEGIKEVEDETSTGFAGFKTKYEQVKAEIDKYYSSGEYKTIGNFIANNLKANYTKAQNLFEPKDTNK